MSRYTITATSQGDSDPDAAIGYDPPLRTFFLQAFPDESGDDLACGSARATANMKRSPTCMQQLLPEASTSCRYPTTPRCCSPRTSQRRPTGRRMTVRSPRC